MLLLNFAFPTVPQVAPSDFNTSYVVIKRHLAKHFLLSLYHFNTSYVVIKPLLKVLLLAVLKDFNTSYVVIKPFHKISS